MDQGGAAEHPREILRRVVTVLHERGALVARSMPGTPARPRTFWQPHHLRIFQLYSQRRPGRGGKGRLADNLGMSPVELARQFRLAQGLLLETYYVVGLLASPHALARTRVVHAHLDVYDGISAPRTLPGGGGDVYWRERSTDSRLAVGERALLRTAALTLTAEDVSYLNLAAAHGWPIPVSVDVRAAASSYQQLVQPDPGADAGHRSEVDVESFAGALHAANQRFRGLTDSEASTPTRLPAPRGTRDAGGRT